MSAPVQYVALPCVEKDDDQGGRYIGRPLNGEAPHFWGVYAVCGEGFHSHVADFNSGDLASLTARLFSRLIAPGK